jgi:diguanylate cyclase (GGDEF)-like protein
MNVDAFSIIIFSIFIKAVLGVLFLIFWLNDRRNSTWFGWWAATYFFGTLAAGFFLLRDNSGDFLAIGVGVTFLVAAFSCCWQGARAFDRRPPLWPPLLLGPAIWFTVCLVPGFLDNVAYRVVLSSLLVAPYLGASAFEIWRGRHEPLQSRWPLMVLFSTLSLFFVSRVVFVNVSPFPFGAAPPAPGWMVVFNLIMFFHTLILTVLIVAMSKERLELEQRMKAQTDPLTGALNRRAFMTRGARLAARHAHERAPLSLLFLDLDHFKSLNDRYGHLAGDDVLMKFVQVVHDNIRPTDFLFRIGGEEFCCLLPRTRADQAHTVAERIRHQFDVASVLVAGTPVKATVSIGIASTEAVGYDIDTLMRKADMAVYAAKRQGRNRVVIAAVDEVTVAARDVLVGSRMAPAA